MLFSPVNGRDAMPADGTSLSPLHAELGDLTISAEWAAARARYDVAQAAYAAAEAADRALHVRFHAELGAPPPTLRRGGGDDEDSVRISRRFQLEQEAVEQGRSGPEPALLAELTAWEAREAEVRERLDLDGAEALRVERLDAWDQAATALMATPADGLDAVLAKLRTVAASLEEDLEDAGRVQRALAGESTLPAFVVHLYRDLVRMTATPSRTAHLAPWSARDWLDQVEAIDGHLVDAERGPVRYAPGAPAQGFAPAPEALALWRALTVERRLQVRHVLAGDTRLRSDVVADLVARGRRPGSVRQVERRESPAERRMAELALSAPPA